MKKVAVFLLMFISGLSASGQSSVMLPNTILLPQANGVESIDSAKVGMLMYNTVDQSLYYRRENEWIKLSNTINNAVTEPTQKIYYTATASPAINGEITEGHHAGQTAIKFLDYNNFVNYSTSGTPGEKTLSPITFLKARGLNDFLFMRAFLIGASITSMEFLFYDETDRLVFSIKISGVFVVKIQRAEPDGAESISVIYKKIAWKDSSVTPSVSGSFDITTNTYNFTY